MSTSRRSIDLVLGTAQFQPEYGRSTRPHVGRKGMDASILRAAATVGVDALDTAPVYGDAETAIGAINNAIPVHTKIDPALDPAASLTRSLDRLGRSHVEVLYVHSSAPGRRRGIGGRTGWTARGVRLRSRRVPGSRLRLEN